MPLDRWMEEVGYKETSGYVRRVMANLRVYRMLYGESKRPATLSADLVPPGKTSDDQPVEDEGTAGDDDTPMLNARE